MAAMIMQQALPLLHLLLAMGTPLIHLHSYCLGVDISPPSPKRKKSKHRCFRIRVS